MILPVKKRFSDLIHSKCLDITPCPAFSTITTVKPLTINIIFDLQARERRERRARRKLLAQMRDISPERETSTTFGSGDFSWEDFGSDYNIKGLDMSDLDLPAARSLRRSKSRSQRKFPGPSAPEEPPLSQRETQSLTSLRSISHCKAKSKMRSRSSSVSQSEPVLNKPDERTLWDQSKQTSSNLDQLKDSTNINPLIPNDIRHIDSTVTIGNDSANEQSIGEILTKGTVEIHIEQINDNEKMEAEYETETAKDNQNNNIEEDDQLELKQELTDGTSDNKVIADEMDTKVSDTESENDEEKEKQASQRKDEEDEQVHL